MPWGIDKSRLSTARRSPYVFTSPRPGWQEKGGPARLPTRSPRRYALPVLFNLTFCSQVRDLPPERPTGPHADPLSHSWQSSLSGPMNLIPVPAPPASEIGGRLGPESRTAPATPRFTNVVQPRSSGPTRVQAIPTCSASGFVRGNPGDGPSRPSTNAFLRVTSRHRPRILGSALGCRAAASTLHATSLACPALPETHNDPRGVH